MTTATTRSDAPTPSRVDVLISDLQRQDSLRLDVDATTPVAELLGRSRAEMALPPDVAFQMRDDGTARLLHPGQKVGEVAREGKANLTVQPDARLG